MALTGKLGTPLPLRLGTVETTAITAGYGQAQAFITAQHQYGFGQAQADIKQTYYAFGQSQARIKQTYQQYGQANAYIIVRNINAFAQSQARITGIPKKLGQAQAQIKQTYQGYAQAQALIVVRNINAFGQAQASIVYKRWAFGQTQAIIIHSSPGPDPGPPVPGPTASGIISPPEYIVVFDGYQLFGYAQAESVQTDMQTDDPFGFDWDGSQTQQAGLTNPTLTMDFLIYTTDWTRAKNQLHETERIMLSSKEERKRLYVDYTDRHYIASFKSIKYQKDVSSSRRLLPYSVEFDVEPQMIADALTTLTGAGTIVTTGRTLANGGWTPTIITVTGIDVTISGFTSTEFTGYLSVSGLVTNLVINSELFTAEINGENANDLLYTVDYAMFVGPGETTFAVTGASSISIKYNDRWY